MIVAMKNSDAQLIECRLCSELSSSHYTLHGNFEQSIFRDAVSSWAASGIAMI